jgi:hypothetical protein
LPAQWGAEAFGPIEEVLGQEQNLEERFVVTSFRGRELILYDFYVGRGEVENQMIEELKLDLKADRLGCHQCCQQVPASWICIHAPPPPAWHAAQNRMGNSAYLFSQVETAQSRCVYY